MGAAPILTILKDGQKVSEFPIEGEAFVGRGKDCLIRLEDRAVSRRHIFLRPSSEGLQIERKSEFAPLVLNGNECTHALVKEGDVIELGPYLLKLSVPKEEQPLFKPEPVAQTLMETPAPEEPGVEPEPLDPLSQQIPEQIPESLIEPVVGQALDLKPEQAPEEENVAVELAVPSETVADSSYKLDTGAVTNAMDPADEGLPVDQGVPESILESPPEEGKTQMISLSKAQAKLVVRQGSANVTEYSIDKNETVIGRSKKCHIVLDDKKASRQNTKIIKNGFSFVLKDLDSANGTYVNKIKKQEHILSSGDVIGIGDAEIVFEAVSLDYAENAPNFIEVPKEILEGTVADEAEVQDFLNFQAPLEQQLPPPAATELPPEQIQDIAGAVPNLGLPPNAKRAKSLKELYQSIPRKWRVYIIVGITFALFMWDDPQEKPVGKESQTTAAQAGKASGLVQTFETLSGQQRFVETQYTLAFDYFKNKDFDKSLFEIDKIFKVVTDYKDAKEVKRYAEEGKRKMEAIQEEKRKKEEEARRRAKVDQYLEQAGQLVLQKKFDEAAKIFPLVLELDPENAVIAKWQQEAVTYQAEQRTLAEERRARQEINKTALAVYRKGAASQKAGNCFLAIRKFGEIFKMGATSAWLRKMARAGTEECEGTIRQKTEPILSEAKQLEDSGNAVRAYKLYEGVTKIDPRNKTAFAGMRRTRDVVHERAKVIYTEAVLAESYSDFPKAKKKYEECLNTAPEGDLYFERAKRKLTRFSKLMEESTVQ